MPFSFLLLLLLAFLIGAIPFAFIVVKKLKGIDIRTVGSGNVGATNAGRVLGKPFFAGVLVLDALKGVVAAGALPWALSFWAAHLPGGASSARIVEVLGSDGLKLCFGIGAFLGHCYSPFLKFKGGKGVATALGVYLVVAPKATLLTLVVCLPLMKITGIVSIASLTGAVLLPIGILVFYWNEQPWTRFCVTVLLSSVVIYRHRANIRRLIEGTEGKKNDSAKS